MNLILIKLHAGRTRFVLAILVALLQRSPAINWLLRTESAFATPLARLIRTASVAASSLGALHSYSGATTFATEPAAPIEGKVGEELSIAFTITGTPEVVQSWGVTGTLPPGVSVPDLMGTTLNARIGTVVGIPTASGSYELLVQPWDRPDQTGDTTGTAFSIEIEIAPSAANFLTSSETPVAAIVGGSFSLSFRIEGFEAASWRILGQLPPGLSVSGPEEVTLEGEVLNAASGTLSGTPTEQGAFEVTAQAFSAPDLQGDTDGDAHVIAVNVADRPRVRNARWESESMFADLVVSPYAVYTVRFSTDLVSWETVPVEAVPGEPSTTFTSPVSQTLESIALGDVPGFYQLVAEPE